MWEEPQTLTFQRVLMYGEALDKQADEKAAWENGCHKIPWMERIDFSKTIYRGGCRSDGSGYYHLLVSHLIFSTKPI